MEKVVSLEKQFCWTMKRNTSLPSLITTGTPYKTITEELKQLATGYNYGQPVILPAGEKWILPAGAYGELCCGAA